MKDDVVTQAAAIIEQEGVEADVEKEVADEIAELLKDGNEVAVFEHEIALQSCTDCDVE